MGRAFPLALAAVIQGFAFGQQVPSSPSSGMSVGQPASASISYAGPGITAPELLPARSPTFHNRPCNRIDGAVTIAAIVDTDGTPRDVHILSTHFPDLDELATQIVVADRFKPGANIDGPTDVAVSIEVKMKTCAKSFQTGNGGEGFTPQLREQPAQKIELLPAPTAPPQNEAAASGLSKVGGRVSPPVPLNAVEAEFSDYARKKRISGVCVVQAIIDVNGMPQDVRVVKSLEPSLDAKAVEAVKKYRFKPAMRDGTVPVPVRITIEVNFRMGKNPGWF